MKLIIVYGTRPEIIKLSKIIQLAEVNQDINTFYVHTGQHYTYNMSRQFLEELNLPKPDVNLKIGSGTQAYQIGTAVIKLEKLFLEQKPDIVIAQGDTNAVFSAALASVKLHIPFAHIESGIRSFDRNMPEEINRVLTDQITDYCFAPTEIAVENLKHEGIPDNKICLTGNTIVEAVQRNLKFAEKSIILKKLNLDSKNYLVLTAHRVENIDNKEKVSEIIKALEQLKQIDMPIVYPIHPRALRKLKEFNLLKRLEKIKNLKLIEPLGYLDFLKLCSNSRLIITDSGGIQEECTIYKKPVLVIRDNTERPEILGSFGILVGCNAEKIVEETKRYINENFDETFKNMKNIPTPYGNGSASNLILDILGKNYVL